MDVHVRIAEEKLNGDVLAAYRQPLPTIDQARIAVIGLGYVGLPLAVEFGKTSPTIGYDIDEHRVAELHARKDRTGQIVDDEFAASHKLRFATKAADIQQCNVYIVSVPTPVDNCKQPDLSGLVSASHCLGAVLQRGNIVIYESTVYPGATEEICVPILEEVSGLVYNKDFYVGYSPERINPGDREHRLPDIPKVTSGSTPEAANFVDDLYRRIIRAGTHKVSSIRVAEAAKVIENTQRDVNIALINELVMLFNRLEINSREVLEAAATKWNFLKFTPGLVGGHCIGVDPYYLTHKAQSVGYHPEIILAGRRINDGMGRYVGSQMVMAMLQESINVNGSQVLIMGVTFKENCPDIRNTRVLDVVNELEACGVVVHVYDPLVDAEEAQCQLGVKVVAKPETGCYDGIVLAVAHDIFREQGAETLRTYGKRKHVLYDVKCIFDKHESDLSL